MTKARAFRTFRFALRNSFWRRTFMTAGLIALVGALALGAAAPGLAAHSPALGSAGNAAPAGNASHTPSTPATAEVRPQEGEEEAAPDPQYAERDTSTDNTWIILGVVMMIVLTVLGFGLAALGLSAE